MKTFILLLASFAMVSQSFASPPRPNVVVIITDDMGFSDIGCYGGEIETPNIDRLAAEGMVFSAAYAAGANCVPSRACLLTGQLRHRHGITGNDLATPPAAVAYTHDIADLAAPEKSVIAQVVISGWSKLLIPGPAQPDKPHSTAPAVIELFDLKSDAAESTNLASRKPDEVRRLKAMQDQAWRLP